ncbi:sulfurtransferase [Sphingobacterium bovistauri]|uniref:Sulfurtransferase n=1 Tax=Sphingobacterium bovistauri TaxID=2781959 RepID=A0ABS7Z788_9SPHI|nr:sulfurtransferase [Sphingobacterium bovistauri]MCA5006068.1 sulfurtransferase [Sphingobacterium bovistauri]
MIFKSSLITAQELADALKQDTIVLLDCTIDKVGQSMKAEKLELIPNSSFFDIEGKLSDNTSSLPHTLVSPIIFENEMQNIGINQTSTVVLYDRWGVYSSPRAWWMFKVMGFHNVYILNGGVPAWKKFNYPISNNYKESVEKGNLKTNYLNEWIADKDYILKHLDGNSIEIFDARSQGRFSGIAPEPRKGLKSGHIPHSKNIPFENLLKGEFYSDIKEIETIFKEQNPRNSTHVFTCGSGITASILAFASHLIGTPNIRVYDGSWSEWGNENLNLPIEK